MRKKIIAVLIAVAFLAVFTPMTSFASSGSVKMTGYDQVIKKGNTVYCAGTKGIYKVILKNGKVKSKKRLITLENIFSPESYLSAMKLKGKYLYYLASSEGTGGAIERVKTTGGKSKLLATVPLWGDYFVYAIKGSKIYYYKIKYDNDYNVVGTPKSVMSVNGKNKSKTSKKAVLKHKKSNASGYSVKIKTSGGYYKDYLKTPKGTFYLGKTECRE